MNLLNNKKALRSLLKHGDVLNTFNGGRIEPKLNIKQHQKEFIINLNAPGVGIDSFELLVDYNKLYINIHLPHPFGDVALSHPIFSRSFNLPGYVELDNIEAHYQKGKLQVILPFKELNGDQ